MRLPNFSQFTVGLALSISLSSGTATLHLAVQPTLTQRQEHIFALTLEVWAMSTATTLELIRFDR